TLIVSGSPPPDSSDSRPPSIASRPSRLSSKNAAWKRVMSMPSAQDLAHGGEQLLGIEGLDQPAGRAGGLAFHLLVATGLGGEHQQRGEAVVGQLAQFADQRDAVHARHVDVGHHRVERTRACDLQGGLAVLGLADLEAARGQGEGDHLSHRGRVVDDEQLLGAHAQAPVLMWVSAAGTADGSAASSTPRLTASASCRAAAASVGEAWMMVVRWPRAARSRTKACSSCSPAAWTRSTWSPESSSGTSASRWGCSAACRSATRSIPRSVWSVRWFMGWARGCGPED